MPPLSPSAKRYSAPRLPPPLRCTHIRFTRLYDHTRTQRCTVCYRIPDLGHLYRCTEDTEGNIPDIDLVDKDLASYLTEYKIGENPPPHRSGPSQATSSAAATLSTFDTSSASATVSSEETTTDELNGFAATGKRKFEAAFPPNSLRVIAGPCHFKICHACRPVFRERAWESIDHIVNDTIVSPTQHELDNRRISNAAIMGNMKFDSLNEDRPQYLNDQEPEPDTAVSPRKLCPANITNANFTDESQESSSGTEDVVHADGGSDADDEKGFGKDETSESSSTDDEANNHRDVRYQPVPIISENQTGVHFASDALPTSRWSIFAERSALDRLPGGALTDTSEQEIEAQNESASEENEQKRRGRALSKGRFYID